MGQECHARILGYNRRMTQVIPLTPPADTAARHRKQVLLQIWLPLGLTVLLVLGLAALAVLGTAGQSSQVNRWGNISSVFLIIPYLFTSLLSAGILYLCIRGVSAVRRKIPLWSLQLQVLLAKLNAMVNVAADKVAAPVLAAQGLAARLSAFRAKLAPHRRMRSS